MPTYTPNVPQSTDIPAQSQDQMLQNFQSIDDGTNGFALNHISYTDATVNQRGKHKFLQMPEQTVAPATAANEGALFTKELSGITNLIWRQENNGSEIQLTNIAPLPAVNGYSFLPGGIFIQWGLVTPAQSVSTRSVVFPTPFAAIYNIQVTGLRASSSPGTTDAWVVSGYTINGFTIYNNGSHSFEFLWMAIGIK